MAGDGRGSETAWVYVLECGDGSLYTGATVDLDRRLAAHQSGKGARYTASRQPVRLVYASPCETMSEALRREAAIKRLPRPRKMALVASAAAGAVSRPS